MNAFQVLLVGNYAPDAQTSMLRFASLLHEGLEARGIRVTSMAPKALLVGRRSSLRGPGKWLGYADKLMVFPPQLRRAARSLAREPLVVHICDHSNATYVPAIRHLPHVVTCHDLLAVRSARGEFGQTTTRWSGKKLQASIARGLRGAGAIVCVSDATRADVLRIIETPPNRVATIAQGLAHGFRPGATAASDRVRAWLSSGRPYLLHVGGDQWYKNREGLIAIYTALVASMPDAPALVVAGKALGRGLREIVRSRRLDGRVVELPNVEDEDLAALYGSASLLLFPSWAEGFGWPLVEAMACRCRVVTSNRPPLTETGGDAVTYIDPADANGAAVVVRDVLSESDQARRARLDAGVARAAGFSRDRMIDDYIAVYRAVVDGRDIGPRGPAA